RAFRDRQLPRDQWPTHLITAHPYVDYILDLPLNPITSEALRSAPPGTCIITDALLWNRERLPSPEELMAWGYRFDPLVDQEIGQVRPTFDLNGGLLSS